MDEAPRRAITNGGRVRPDKLELARALRKSATASEKRVWELLRDRRCHGLKFRRQQVVRGFVVDFYCAAHRLAVEIDGGVHHEPDQLAWDAERTALLARSGIIVLRFADDTPDEAIRARLALLTPL
jgi:very-short-patch-repair endonuclease